MTGCYLICLFEPDQWSGILSLSSWSWQLSAAWDEKKFVPVQPVQAGSFVVTLSHSLWTKQLSSQKVSHVTRRAADLCHWEACLYPSCSYHLLRNHNQHLKFLFVKMHGNLDIICHCILVYTVSWSKARASQWNSPGGQNPLWHLG